MHYHWGHTAAKESGYIEQRINSSAKKIINVFNAATVALNHEEIKKDMQRV